MEEQNNKLHEQLETFNELISPLATSGTPLQVQGLNKNQTSQDKDDSLLSLKESLQTPPPAPQQQQNPANNSIQQQQQQQQQLLQQLEILGAVKVRDGLFLGDEFASQDLEFVIANKVTHIINCAGRQIFNQWTPVGVKYLTFYWLDDDRQLIFDDNDQVAKEIYDFIEEANQDQSGVLVHSVRGQSRACCVLSIYMMMKFRWTLLKSLEFINSRRPNLEIRASFLQQLSSWERRTRDTYPKRTDRWDELFEDYIFHVNGHMNEELLLRNTFVNAQMQPVNYLQQWKEDVLTSISQSGRLKTRIRWGDNHDETQKHNLIRENSDEDLINKEEQNIKEVDNHKRDFQGHGILKKIDQHVKKLHEEKKVEKTIQQTPKPRNAQLKEEKSITLKEDSKSLEALPKNVKKRPVTPLLSDRRKDNSDLIATSPRSFQLLDDRSLNSTQQVASFKSSQKTNPKRSSSSKKIDREKEEKDKRDKYKAKIAWKATSPKNKSQLGGTNLNIQRDNSGGDLQIKIENKSPNRSSSSSSILKRELLEKAKKALAENSKVNVVLDIKKIQETLNKIATTDSKPITLLQTSSTSNIPSQQSSQAIQKSQGNIINNNNINNFFIQNTSVIEIPKTAAQVVEGFNQDNQKQTKTQAPIGQHHHKRANSGSLQIAQQIKQGLASTNPVAIPLNHQVQGSHRKNQLSEQLPLQQQQNVTPFNLAADIYKGSRPQSSQQNNISNSNIVGNSNSRKDFKQVIKQLQKDSLSAMQNSQQFWLNQAKKFQYKNHSIGSKILTSQQDSLQIGKKQMSYPQNVNKSGTIRPSSAQGQIVQNSLGSGMHRNRKLRKSNEFMPQSSQPVLQQSLVRTQRRAQTPMPASPTNNIIQQSELQTAKMAGPITSSGLSIQNMSFNNNGYSAGPLFISQPKSIFKKRSKSPSTTSQVTNSYKQKMQAKAAYMLMNNTGGFLNQTKRKAGYQSPTKNAWIQ